MLQQMTSPQLTELEAFWSIEGGWGEYKEDYRNAQILSMQANINRDSKRKPEPYNAEDFVMRPKLKDTEEKPEQVRAGLDALAGKKAKKK